MREKCPLLNTHVSNVTMAEAVEAIDHLIGQKKNAYIVPVNVDVIVKMEQDPYLKQITNSADMVLADGKPLIWISKLYGRPIKAKISGSDLVPLLFARAAQKGYRIFIMGGRRGVAEKAKKRMEEKYEGIRITGTYAPEFGFEKDAAELEKMNRIIAAAQPDLLIVCLGCPKQEKWVYENYQKCGAAVSICAGATVDFLSGNVKRAPGWMSEHGLEWLYRFCQEPKRLFKRYFVDDVKILKLIWKYR